MTGCRISYHWIRVQCSFLYCGVVSGWMDVLDLRCIASAFRKEIKHGSGVWDDVLTWLV